MERLVREPPQHVDCASTRWPQSPRIVTSDWEEQMERLVLFCNTVSSRIKEMDAIPCLIDSHLISWIGMPNTCSGAALKK